MSTLASLGGAAIGAVGGAISGIGSGKRARKLVMQQEQSQSRLNEQAAKLGYDYGELAADSAHERSLALQQNQADLTSYKAQVADLKEAGANPALALAGGGASVGAGGGAMGGSGGSGGRAGGAAEAAEQELQRKGLALELGKVAQEGYLIKAERDKAKAEKAQIEAETRSIEQKNESFQGTNALQDELLRQQGISQWIENARKDWEDREYSGTDRVEYTNEKTGEFHVISENGHFNRRITNEVIEALSRTSYNDAAAALTTEKQKYYFQQILNETLNAETNARNASTNERNAESERIKALAQNLSAEHGTGRLSNWNTWKQIGKDVADKIRGSLSNKANRTVERISEKKGWELPQKK